MRNLLFCLFVILPTAAISQDTDIHKVACRFLCMEGVTPPHDIINLGGEAGEIRCEIAADRLSPQTICIAKGKALNFHTSGDHKPVASAAIKENLKSAILVFLPAAKTSKGLPWRVFVIEDSPGNFPDGGAFVANFHSQDVRFIIGENKAMLRPAGSHGFAKPEQRDDFNMAAVVFQFQQDQEWRTASESMLRFLPGLRYLMFAYVDPQSGRPRIATLQDIKPINPESGEP
jgi:hypothetical protein